MTRPTIAHIPHLDSGATHREFINGHGWKAIYATTVCGIEVACTLVTRQPDKVRCPNCKEPA